jgi:hypothetical protein
VQNGRLQSYVRVAMRLGAAMLPDKFALHAIYDRVGPLNRVVGEASTAKTLSELQNGISFFVPFAILLQRILGIVSFPVRDKPHSYRIF